MISGTREPSGWDHGGPAPGERGRPLLDASTTVNPFPSSDLLSLLGRELGEARRYPDPWAQECREAIAARHRQSSDRIVTGPGATLLLYQLLGTEPVGRLLLPEPVFSEYARAADAAGVPVHRIPPSLDLPLSGRGALRWGIDPEGAWPRFRRGDLMVLVNPVNPTGQELSPEKLRALSLRLDRAGGRLLVDESFQDFIDNRSSLLPEAGEGGLLVLRSLTKIVGLPGIRAGFLAGPEEVAGRLRTKMGPWATGHLEGLVMRWAMERRTATGFGWEPRFREPLFEGLERLGIEWVIGEGPMVLASPGWSAGEGRERRDRLGAMGIRIRLAEGFGPPDGARLLRIGCEAFSDPGRFLEAFQLPPKRPEGDFLP